MGFSISAPPRLIHSPRWQASPSAVPSTIAKITAGIFSISGMELMPMPMAQTPNTLFSSVVKRVDRRWLKSVPKIPPNTTAATFTIIPIIKIPSVFLRKNTPESTHSGRISTLFFIII